MVESKFQKEKFELVNNGPKEVIQLLEDRTEKMRYANQKLELALAEAERRIKEEEERIAKGAKPFGWWPF